MKRFILIITIAIFSISAQAKAPKAPSDLKVVDVTYNSIAIAWRDNSDNEKGFRIYREDSNKRAFRLIKTLPPNSTFYRDTGLRSFTAYRYQVRAFNDDGEGISSTMSATTSKKTPSYTFYPASIFEIPQYDPYKIHVKISSNKCRAIVLKTGQTTSYANYDDGYYQKGAARSYTRDNTKEIVIDNTTKLQWQDDSDAKTVVIVWNDTKTVEEAWNEAKEYCENLTLGGYDDWRLPSQRELLTIVDYGRSNPAIDPVFRNIPDSGLRVYWSSTGIIGEEIINNWPKFVLFGESEEWDEKIFVRCVRGERLEIGNFSRDDTKKIVTDNCTNLQWQDNSEVKTVTKTWSEAIDYCENLTLGGYNDWRLPNINELYSIVDRSRYNPAIDPVFQNIPDNGWRYYWSSTSVASDSSDAWVVYFYDGLDYWVDKSGSFFVRCVRAGQ